MRRDMDLIRELLLKLEALPMRPGTMVSFDSTDDEVAVEGRSAEDIEHHLGMIYRAGFVDFGTGPIGGLSGSYYFRDLTWQARDFLDAVRKPKVWTETKTRAEKIGGWTIGVLTDLAKGYLKAEAAKHGFPMG